jgi:hypothetical protein
MVPPKDDFTFHNHVKGLISCGRAMVVWELFFINNTKLDFYNAKFLHPKVEQPMIDKA